MLAATAISQSATDPLSGLVLRETAKPRPRPGWSVVRVVASSLNMHDLWTLRGVGHPPERLALPLEEIHKGFQLMIDGALTGKLVINPPR